MTSFKRITYTAFAIICTIIASSCVHEFSVTDYSFSFNAEVIYDGSADSYCLTLTRESGLEENEYDIAFTLDGKCPVSLTDMDGRVHKGSFTEMFGDVSTRTYGLPKMDPGEHTLSLVISTDSYSQSIDIAVTVEDFSFRFDSNVLFNEETKAHSLEITLAGGSAEDKYTVSYTIDNLEPRKTYQETFSDRLTRTYDLPALEPGEHTLNLLISTERYSQKLDIPFTVNDYSFEVKADIEYDSANLSHSLFLTLLKGPRDESYTVSCSVDGGHGVKLTDVSGRELTASFNETFSDALVRSYSLSRADIGRHTMLLVICTDDFSQEIEIQYEVAALPFSIHAEAVTSGASSSALLVSLTEGAPDVAYTITVSLDGKPLEGASPLTADFLRAPILTLTLPLLRPGRHQAVIEMTDGHSVRTSTLTFSEPVRHPCLDITLSRDANGCLTAVFGDNPYGITVTVETLLTITGKCTYWIGGGIIYNDAPRESEYRRTKEKTLTDGGRISGAYGNVTAVLTDRDALAREMTDSYEPSSIWRSFDDNSGEGGYFYQVTGTEPSYYRITSEKLTVGVSAEKVAGVTMRIENRIGPMTLNGKSSSSGTTDITL